MSAVTVFTAAVVLRVSSRLSLLSPVKASSDDVTARVVIDVPATVWIASSLDRHTVARSQTTVPAVCIVDARLYVETDLSPVD